jgi:uncharacterized membrane protein
MEGKELLGDQYFTFLGISLVGMLISGAVPLILVGPVYCGMALCLLKQARNGPMVFDDLFKGFEYFGQSIIAALVYFGATLVVFIPFAIAYVAGMVMIASGEGPLIGIGIVLLILVVLMSSFVTVMGGVVFFFACNLIVERNMEGLPAIGLAFKGFMKNAIGITFAALLGQIAMFIAAMLCFVPMLFVLPIMLAGHFVIYKKVFGDGQVKPPVAQAV